MDYRHSYAGDKIWKYTKGIDLKNLRKDLTGQDRSEMFGLVRPRRENGYILAPARMKEVKDRYNMIKYKYTYSIGGVYAISLFSVFKFSKMSLIWKIIGPHVGCYFLYKYYKKKGDKLSEDLTKELYFEIEDNYRKYRHSGDLAYLGDHIDICTWEEIKLKLTK
jgi:hypothetical protein